MSITLATTNIPAMSTEGFFNEFEPHILAKIMEEGSGYYKLSHVKDGGMFTAAAKVTEADDAAVLNEFSDRFVQVGETEDYEYVNFAV